TYKDSEWTFINIKVYNNDLRPIALKCIKTEGINYVCTESGHWFPNKCKNKCKKQLPKDTKENNCISFMNEILTLDSLTESKDKFKSGSIVLKIDEKNVPAYRIIFLDLVSKKKIGFKSVTKNYENQIAKAVK
ncbi:MAG: hypothetical protein M3Z87_17780, partial [Lactobacillus sp.]|nr:hypothetical protein [Lactobacillus sp.]